MRAQKSRRPNRLLVLALTTFYSIARAAASTEHDRAFGNRSIGRIEEDATRAGVLAHAGVLTVWYDREKN